MLRQLFHIKSQKTDEGSQQVLSLQVGERHCAIAVTNATGDQLYELFYYSCNVFEANPLPQILADHESLDRTFYQVQISYDFPQSVLTPAQHFQHEEAGLLLKSLYGLNGTSVIISEQVGRWQLHNIYSVPKELHDWVTRKYAAAKFWHQYSIQLKSLQLKPDSGQILVDFRTDEFVVVVENAGKILLTQTIPYSTPEDVLFHLLKVCNQFNLSQEGVQLIISGLIEQQSALYKELYQYFIHVQFKTPGWNVEPNEYPLHFFTSLNDLARCES